MNLFSFIIFQNADSDIPLYKYLKIYTLSNMVILASTAVSFITCAYRVFPWTNSELTLHIGIYYLLQIENLAYFYGSVLDCVILLDRISTFKKNVKAWFKLSPYTICLICLMSVIIVSGPYYFTNQVSSVTFRLNSTENFTVWFFRVCLYYGWQCAYFHFVWRSRLGCDDFTNCTKYYFSVLVQEIHEKKGKVDRTSLGYR